VARVEDLARGLPAVKILGSAAAQLQRSAGGGGGAEGVAPLFEDVAHGLFLLSGRFVTWRSVAHAPISASTGPPTSKSCSRPLSIRSGAGPGAVAVRP